MANNNVGSAQQVSLESILIQFHEHQRVINKSMSAQGDIVTQLYNEVVTRQRALDSEAGDGTSGEASA